MLVIIARLTSDVWAGPRLSIVRVRDWSTNVSTNACIILNFNKTIPLVLRLLSIMGGWLIARGSNVLHRVNHFRWTYSGDGWRSYGFLYRIQLIGIWLLYSSGWLFNDRLLPICNWGLTCCTIHLVLGVFQLVDRGQLSAVWNSGLTLQSVLIWMTLNEFAVRCWRSNTCWVSPITNIVCFW